MSIGSANSISAISYRNSAIYKENNNKDSLLKSPYSEKQEEHNQRISKLKRMIRNANQNQDQNKPKSVVEQTLSYGDSIRASRNKAKTTSDQLKKLKYNFKDISSQIRKSKTSVNAKQVASKARREVAQLKMKLQTGKYDKEELEAAIVHAKAMERAANKKARHLEEEELIKISDGESNGTAAVVSEGESKIEEKIDEIYEKSLKEVEQEKEAELDAQMEAMQEALEEAMEESVEELSEDMSDLLEETMEDLMEQTLGDLAESMMAITDYEMTEDEFKLFKLKHRASEDKSMLEADAKYLKAMFEIYDRHMNGGSDVISGVTNDSSVGSIGGFDSIPIQNVVDVFV